jgi:hypothetical protein
VEEFRRESVGFHGSILFIHRAGSENAAHQARNHQISVRANDAHGHSTGIVGQKVKCLLARPVVGGMQVFTVQALIAMG